MKKGKKRDVFITISYILLAATIPITLLFSHLIGNHMTRHIYQTLDNSAALCAEMIERQYANDVLMLEGLAVRMSVTLESDIEQGIERMVSTAERYGMKRIAFSSPDGTTYTTDNADMDLTGIENFERAMAGETHLTTVISDVMDGRDVNIYSLPVYSNETNEILGVLSAVYSSEVFRDLLAVQTYEGEGYTYIIDRDGNVVIGSSHENALLNEQNVFTYMASHKENEETVAEVQVGLRNSDEGFFDIHNDEGDRIACYKPLNMNGWYVVSVVPENVAERTRNAVMLSVMVYCVSISVIAIYVVLSIRNSQKMKNRLLKKALYEDELTGGRTYQKFCIDCRERLDRKADRHALCIFLDIDNFNLVSTLYGNEASDNVICDIYHIIQNAVGDSSIICRNSADQFCIMYFYDDPAGLEQKLQQFKSLLQDTGKYENMLRPSIGIYMVEDRDESIDDMVNKARTAHETIKHNSGTLIAYYDESFRNTMYENRHFEDEMEQALKNHEFVPYLQPKYKAETGEICGAEALIRWITPEGNIISPGKFIPLAENNGFIRELDKEMFSMVCKIQKDFVDKGKTPVPISVNVSRQLMYDRNFADDYYSLLQEKGLTPDMIELEITESALFEDLDLFRVTLEKLRGYGFRILMDDFGTGYSSLMMLKSVPIDEIKLDKSFVDDYDDEKGSSIICTVLGLAKRLQLPVVAEGVETENQYIYLKQMGCDIIQGFYFSKPVPVADFVLKVS